MISPTGSVWNNNKIDLTNPSIPSLDAFPGRGPTAPTEQHLVLPPISTSVGTTGSGPAIRV